MTAKNWCCVLLSSVAAIAIATHKKAVATSYVPCGFTFYSNAKEIMDRTEKAEAYYLAADDCYHAAQRHSRSLSIKDWYARGVVKYYTKAIALNPGVAKTHLSYTRLGEIHREEDYSQSLENYSLAIALIPNLPRAYNGRAKTYALLKQSDLALADYTEAINIDANAASFLGRGNVYLSLKQKSEAIADYTKAIAIQPNFSDAYIARGDAYRRLKHDRKAISDYSKAITLLKNAIATYSDNNYTSRVGVGLGDKLAEVYLHRAELYRQAANYQQAVQDYQESNFLQPLPSESYLGRAEAYRQTKQYQKALNDYVKIIRRNKAAERAEAYLGMGYVYRDRQQRNLALENFERAAYLFEWQQDTAKYQTALEEMSKL